MIYTEKFKIPLKDIGKDNKIKNRAVLEILENTVKNISIRKFVQRYLDFTEITNLYKIVL